MRLCHHHFALLSLLQCQSTTNVTIVVQLQKQKKITHEQTGQDCPKYGGDQAPLADPIVGPQHVISMSSCLTYFLTLPEII